MRVGLFKCKPLKRAWTLPSRLRHSFCQFDEVSGYLEKPCDKDLRAASGTWGSLQVTVTKIWALTVIATRRCLLLTMNELAGSVFLSRTSRWKQPSQYPDCNFVRQDLKAQLSCVQTPDAKTLRYQMCVHLSHYFFGNLLCSKRSKEKGEREDNYLSSNTIHPKPNGLK